MTGPVVLVAICGAAAAVGLVVGTLAVAESLGWKKSSRGISTTTESSGSTRPDHRHLRQLGLPVAAGIVAVVVTGWPATGPIAAAVGWGLPRVLRETRTAASVESLEAIATWTEMLHGTLAASAGLGQALVVTADLSPAPLRPALQRLAGQIRVGVAPRTALLEFADSLDDPCADRVVCSLLLAFSARAQRLGDLLGALAESTRQEVALQLRVETSRASVRSGVRTVVLFSLGFVALLAVFAHSYLAPFATPAGQVVLVAVAGLYATAIVLMVSMSKPPRAIRLLAHSEESR